MKICDLMIQNACIVTVDENNKIYDNACLFVKNGLIIDILTVNEGKYLPEITIDAKGKMLIPGFINTHTHIPMTYFRGLADDLPLNVWLEQYIWPNEAKFISESFIYDASLHGIAELIKNGVTCFNDMYFYPAQTALVAEKLGVRAVLADVGIDFAMAEFHNPQENFDKLFHLCSQFKNSTLIDFSIGPHSIYACSTETLLKAKSIAEKYNKTIHLHLSETEFEVNQCLKNHGLRPVEYLHKIGFLTNKMIFAHGVWLNENEIKLMKDYEISVSLNTESNLKLASGFAPVKQFVEHNINLCLGTDGVASNNNLSMFDEMSLTAKLHKSLNNDPTFLKASDVLRMATINGAKALHLESQIGSLEINKKADFVLLNTDTLEFSPHYDPYSLIVYAMNNQAVSDVFINGKAVMLDKKILNIDENLILNNAKKYKAIIRG